MKEIVLGGMWGGGWNEAYRRWGERRWGGNWDGGGPIFLGLIGSATLPHFYCLIYAPGDNIRRILVEI